MRYTIEQLYNNEKIHEKAFFGKNLTNYDLCGADLRDKDLSGANLSKSIFLTQAQINSARGDAKTKLPPMITRPFYWE